MITMDKKYQTKSGSEVRLYAIDAGGEYPVHGAVKSGEEWISMTWDSTGNFAAYTNSDCSLVEVPETKSFWANVYDGWIGVELDEIERDSAALAIIRVDVTGGKVSVHVED